MLCSFDLFLDVSEEQVLVERVDVTHRLVFRKGVRLTCFVIRNRTTLTGGREERVACLNRILWLFAELILALRLTCGLMLTQFLHAILCEHNIL